MRLPIVWPTSKQRGILLSILCLIPLLTLALLVLVSRLFYFSRAH